MPFVRIWVHLIWATKCRDPILTPDLRGKVFSHIRANARAKGVRLDTINGTDNHVHALVSLKSDQTIARVAQLLKGESSRWVNREALSKAKFEWQDDYIAASVSDRSAATVRAYIGRQEEHHRRKPFDEEYDGFLREYGFKEDSPNPPEN